MWYRDTISRTKSRYHCFVSENKTYNRLSTLFRETESLLLGKTIGLLDRCSVTISPYLETLSRNVNKGSSLVGPHLERIDDSCLRGAERLEVFLQSKVNKVPGLSDRGIKIKLRWFSFSKILLASSVLMFVSCVELFFFSYMQESSNLNVFLYYLVQCFFAGKYLVMPKGHVNLQRLLASQLLLCFVTGWISPTLASVTFLKFLKDYMITAQSQFKSNSTVQHIYVADKLSEVVALQFRSENPDGSLRHSRADIDRVMYSFIAFITGYCLLLGESVDRSQECPKEIRSKVKEKSESSILDVTKGQTIDPVTILFTSLSFIPKGPMLRFEGLAFNVNKGMQVVTFFSLITVLAAPYLVNKGTDRMNIRQVVISLCVSKCVIYALLLGFGVNVYAAYALLSVLGSVMGVLVFLIKSSCNFFHARSHQFWFEVFLRLGQAFVALLATYLDPNTVQVWFVTIMCAQLVWSVLVQPKEKLEGYLDRLEDHLPLTWHLLGLTTGLCLTQLTHLLFPMDPVWYLSLLTGSTLGLVCNGHSARALRGAAESVSRSFLGGAISLSPTVERFLSHMSGDTRVTHDGEPVSR